MYQAEFVAERLRTTHPQLEIELVPMTTAGDRDARALGDIRSRGLFAAELERALLAGAIDCAVHSSKDLTFDDAHAELRLVAWMPREDPRDALCMPGKALVSLPQNARIATGAARRMSALRTLRDDLTPVPIRGNIATRLERSRERGDHACMLALAGLTRLNLLDQVGYVFEVSEVVPEAGQGAIVVQARANGHQLVRRDVDWSLLDHQPTAHACRIERGVSARLGGGCDRPIGVHVTPAGEAYVFVAEAPAQPGVIVTTYLPVEMDDASSLGAAEPSTAAQCAALEQHCIDHILDAVREQLPTDLLHESLDA